MKIKELRAKSADELNNELLELLKAQFSLRMQHATQQLVFQTVLFLKQLQQETLLQELHALCLI